MTEVFELATFTVRDGHEHELLAGRPAMIAALRRAFPGLAAAWLTRNGDGSWTDVIRWRSRAEAEYSAAHVTEVPEAAAWFAHIGESRGIQHLEVLTPGDRHSAAEPQDRYERGFARYAELGSTGTRGHVYDDLASIAPDLPRFIIEFGYGDIHSRPGLDAARRELVILGSLITLGGVEPQLEVHIGAALNAGLSPVEVAEAIQQVLPYAGFPRVVTAMNIAKRVFGARGLLQVQQP